MTTSRSVSERMWNRGGGIFADVFSDPVSDAKAAPPEVKEAPCSIDVGGAHYAEVAFPGKTVNELGMAHALTHATTPSNGYEWYQSASVSVKDGFVLVYCYSNGTGVPVVDGVRVLVPAA